MQPIGFKVEGLGVRVGGSRFRVQGVGLKNCLLCWLPESLRRGTSPLRKCALGEQSLDEMTNTIWNDPGGTPPGVPPGSFNRFGVYPNPGNHSIGPHVDDDGRVPRWSILADLDWHF